MEFSLFCTPLHRAAALTRNAAYPYPLSLILPHASRSFTPLSHGCPPLFPPPPFSPEFDSYIILWHKRTDLPRIPHTLPRRQHHNRSLSHFCLSQFVNARLSPWPVAPMSLCPLFNARRSESATKHIHPAQPSSFFDSGLIPRPIIGRRRDGLGCPAWCAPHVFAVGVVGGARI